MDYKEFKKILIDNDLTLKEFAQLSNMSYNTCVRWGKDDRPVSNWVEPFLNLYMKNIKLEKEVKKHREFKQGFHEMVSGTNTLT